MTTDPRDTEIARLTRDNECWKANSRETWQAMQAMRNSINEHVPMPSLESDMLQGPENSIFCATVAASVVEVLTAAQAERDAALAQVATAITGNKSGTICRDCRGVGMIHCSDPFNCGGMQPYTLEELKAALSRRDAQMRAEGMRKAADLCGKDNGPWEASPWSCRQAILAAAKEEEK